ncbi:MAG: phage holin family protein [candidate division WWE3 bacterium]|nr:phage holin family protein [candidate division WWE3 bacterium]
MKSILRHIFINLVAIYVVGFVVTGIDWRGDLKVLLLAALALGIINVTVRPIVKIITLPINAITLGLFSIVVNALMLYAVTLIIPGFFINAFNFSGLNLLGVIIPAAHLSKITATVAAAVGISVITGIFNWFVE